MWESGDAQKAGAAWNQVRNDYKQLQTLQIDVSHAVDFSATLSVHISSGLLLKVAFFFYCSFGKLNNQHIIEFTYYLIFEAWQSICFTTVLY